MLASEFLEMKDLGIDLGSTAFDPHEIDTLLANPDVDEAANAVPELPEHPVSELGDLWLCGQHRVLCGDSTSESAVARLLAPKRAIPQPFLMATDPPYGVEYDPIWRDECPQTGHGPQWKNKGTGLVSNDDRIDWSPAFQLFPGNVAYIWHAGVYAAEVAAGILAAGFQIRGQIIWKKQHFVFGRGAYHWQHEPCWYAVRKGQAAHWHGDRKQSTIWEVANLNPMGGNKDEAISGHGTQKPVELMRRPILNHTTRGEAVYDPFLGSGTTMIAAELTGRICYGLEIDPKYVDVIVTRWQNQAGKEATLDGHGATFAHVKEGRRLRDQDAIREEAFGIPIPANAV